jgi:hypothetical protein
MEYLWPDRRHRLRSTEDDHGSTSSPSHELPDPDIHLLNPTLRSSLDSPRALQQLHPDSAARNLAPPGMRKLTASRSCTDLRSTHHGHHLPHLFPSNSGLSDKLESPDTLEAISQGTKVDLTLVDEQGGDAAVMMTRSSQKTFVFVKVARFVFIHVVLHIHWMILMCFFPSA